MLQSSVFDGVAFDPFSLQADSVAFAEVDVGRLDAVVRRVGVPAARRLAWGIDTLSGREAHALGLADEIVEGNVLSVAMERARAIAGLPSVQAQAVKRFFSTYCEDEAADIAANGLFIEMTKTAKADATFRQFSTAHTRETS
jgi:enoyl-CoA hydratase/carnithine racemase